MINADPTTRPPRTREKTREQILEAARIALTRDGYERITTRRIADEAGVNIATLHYYFGTKEALLTEAVRHSLSQVEGQVRAAIAGAPSTAAALERAFAATWELVRTQRGLLRYDLVVRGFRDEAARREADLIYGVFRQLTEEILRRHLVSVGKFPAEVTVSELAYYVVSAVDGAILQYMISGDATATLKSFALIRGHILWLLDGSHNSSDENPLIDNEPT